MGGVPENGGAIGVVRSGFWTLELGQMEGGTGGPERARLGARPLLWPHVLLLLWMGQWSDRVLPRLFVFSPWTGVRLII